MTALHHPTAGDLVITIERDRPAVVIAIGGELDLATADRARGILLDLIDGEGLLDIVVDVSALSFVDSTGLGVLVGAHRKLKERGGRLVVAAPTPASSRVLQITGLDRVLLASGDRA